MYITDITYTCYLCRYNRSCAHVSVGSNAIPIVNKAKYLGVFICASKVFKLSYREPRTKFYQSFNGLLYKTKYFKDEIVLLNL